MSKFDRSVPPDLRHPLWLHHTPHARSRPFGFDAKPDLTRAVAQDLRGALELLCPGHVHQHADVRYRQQVREAVPVHAARLTHGLDVDADAPRPQRGGKFTTALGIRAQEAASIL